MRAQLSAVTLAVALTAAGVAAAIALAAGEIVSRLDPRRWPPASTATCPSTRCGAPASARSSGPVPDMQNNQRSESWRVSTPESG
ncbi:hypothetical protein GS421_00290 [Rhodococcus hoagii]|nr:hypothetical protein [Prescottella equi]